MFLRSLQSIETGDKLDTIEEARSHRPTTSKHKLRRRSLSNVTFHDNYLYIRGEKNNNN
jgi:hypothetical protein